MVKQTKKGSIGKKALSAILAASMIMTSSSFVMAGPVVEEVEAVAVEEAAAQVNDVVDENVGAKIYEISESKFTIGDGEPFSYVADGVSDLFTALQAAKVKVKDVATGTVTPNSLTDIINDAVHYTVTVTNPAGDKTVITSATTAATLPHGVGTYTVTVEGTATEDANSAVKGSATSTYTINDNTSVTENDAFDFVVNDGKPVYYTGQACTPKVELSVKEVKGTSDDVYRKLTEGTDYKVVGYKDNTNAGTAKAEIQFMGLFAARGTKEFDFTITTAAASVSNIDVTIKNPVVVYNGKEQTADIEVKFTPGGSTTPVTLVESKDYTLSNHKQTDAGKHSVNIDLVDDKFGSYNPADVTFEIQKQEFNEKTVSVTLPEVYFGSSSNMSVDKIVVKDAATGNKLPVGDYSVKFSTAGDLWSEKPVSNADPANKNKTFSVKITANATNYKTPAEIIKTYTITELNADTLENYIKKQGVSMTGAQNENEYEYDVNGVVPSFKIGTTTFTAPIGGKGGEVTVGNIKATFPAKKDCKALGEYKIKLEGLDVYAGQTAEVSYKVVAKDVTGFNTTDVAAGTNKVIISNGTGTAAPTLHRMKDGKELFAVMQIKDKKQVDSKDVLLVNGVDYDYVITEGASAAEASLVINFKGNYKGTVTFADINVVSTTNAIPLDSDIVTAVVTKNYVYDSAAKEPKAEDISVTATVDGKTIELRPNIDFELDKTSGSAYDNNVKVGEATVKIKAVNNSLACSGTRDVKFQITATETEKENYVVDTTALKSVYDYGTAFTPSVSVKTKAGRVLAKSEYTVTYYRDGKEVTTADAYGTTAKAGVVTMKVTVNATKTDVLETSYRIATELDKVADIPETFADVEYTGSAIEPEVKLVKAETKVPFEEGKDYTVTYSDNVKTGTAVITIQGIGDYYGTYVRTFKIVGEMAQEISVLPAQEKALKSRTLNDKATKVKFTKDLETAVTYTSSDKDVVTVDAEGNIKYTGLGEATITIKTAAENGYKEAVKELKVVVGLKQPTFSPSSKNNAFTVTTSTVKGAEKFQVQYVPTGKSFTSKAAKSKTFTVDNKLKKGKIFAANKETYRIRVRAINGDTKSKWSPVKTIATK